ncbi:hypothetical protein HYH03_015076 [Edaphochlamys debaryana]|uniref:Uncharacterized protein n=1 Tax=Edaphochlamys debaryana TaxID=47281 RepID=A0A836BRL6_9CHLO|nr:hypothetical protein HYH03_015076 [Edaphochlamys debaryana]|eukprot:KAG2486252.1 hypothetical protein HYH03_015076 [Edaphochlamys debaryana]
MNLMLRIRVEQAHNSYVRLWEHQGSLIFAYDTFQWVRDITTFVPPKLINSYPYKLAEETGEIRDCGDPNGAECQKGYWTPGDWLIHFPGGGKPYARTFLDRYPPDTWPGANDPTNW